MRQGKESYRREHREETREKGDKQEGNRREQEGMESKRGERVVWEEKERADTPALRKCKNNLELCDSMLLKAVLCVRKIAC